MAKQYSVRVPKEGDVYIYVDQVMLALPLSITILRVNKEFPQAPNLLQYSYNYYIQGGSKANSSLSKAEPYLDLLKDQEYITYQHSFIYPNDLNTYGIYPYIQNRLERELAQFFWDNKVRGEDVECYRLNERDKTFHYYNKRISADSLAFKVAFLLGWLRKRDLIESVWHPLFPEYNWLSNNGCMTWEQVDVCIKKGIEPRYHVYECLKRVPQFWYREILRGNIEEIFLNDYYTQPPLWWRSLIGGDFFCYLTKKQTNKLMTVLRGHVPRDFAKEFMDVYPPMFDTRWDDYRAIFRKRTTYEHYFRRNVFTGEND